ncbi:hypothetical protein B0H14DRAFT_3528737 [Mycena olivaceomarginata]|nr:hypothetical protein B0H14DRAFT_3528737 [Mycena olivaceomarginata]
MPAPSSCTDNPTAMPTPSSRAGNPTRGACTLVVRRQSRSNAYPRAKTPPTSSGWTLRERFQLASRSRLLRRALLSSHERHYTVAAVWRSDFGVFSRPLSRSTSRPWCRRRMNVVAGSSRRRGEAYSKLQQLLEEERSDHCEYPLQLGEALAVGSIVMRVS